ncbi:caspase domain-containing protein [Streptomyces sp. NPDC092952]|uniref:caspase family protein n=1 Tax=Streptomyces sp. NPDC092952 TaxID=3366018 RepID=UPI0038018C04
MPNSQEEHAGSSRALLIGVSDYAEPGLPGIPAARNNLDALENALSGERGLFRPEDCRVLGRNGEAVDRHAVGRALVTAAREAEELLLVYFAGHGRTDDEDNLHLLLTDAHPERNTYATLPFDQLRNELRKSRAATKVIMLDCCFSGLAAQGMADPHAALLAPFEANRTCTLTSAARTELSYAPPGDRYTAFTAALLSALEQPEALTLDQIHHHVCQELVHSGLQHPQFQTDDTVGNVVLTRGPARKNPPTNPARPSGRQEVRITRDRGPAQRAAVAFSGAVFLACGGLAAYKVPEELLVLPFPAVFLPSGFFLAWSSVRRHPHVLITRSGMELTDRRNRPNVILWKDVAHLGFLKEFPYRNRRAKPRTAEDVLAIRLKAGSPPPAEGTVLRSGPFRDVSLSFLGMGYAGFRVADAGTDLPGFQDAVERVGRLRALSDQELRERDPRLRSLGES